MSFGWLALALSYLCLLFWIAKWGDRNTPTSRWLTSNPLVYSLALGIYCTAWTFFGAVGQASRDNWLYLPILLGPVIVYLIFHRFIRKLVLVSKKQHISTIADFISARYGKRQIVALLVTIIALLATIPYIALQLKAIGSIFILISEEQHSQIVIMIATLFIAVFAMYFGTKNTDVTEYRRGLMLAISFESCIKLLALVLVAIVGYQYYSSSPTATHLQSFASDAAIDTFYSFTFWAQTVMAAAAVICLPRQFHVAVVDNLNLEHLKQARWVFPLYLLIIAITIPIIAAAGDAIFSDSEIKADNYVLGLAMMSDSLVLEIIVFIGGLSAATAMIIVATLTLSTMITNDVVLPKLLEFTAYVPANKIRRIKLLRRAIIFLILVLAFLYQQQMTNQSSLASIGLLAFSLVIHLLPSIVGGLYWKQGHAHGVYAGLLAGIVVWTMWLMLPVLGGGSPGVDQSETLSQGAMVSLLANVIAYITFSLITKSRLIDRIQAEAFVSPADANSPILTVQPHTVTVDDLNTLITKFTGPERSQQLFDDFAARNGTELNMQDAVDNEFLSFCERALGGVVGSSSAKALIDSLVRGKKLDITEVVNFFEESAQAVDFNVSALMTSIENLDQGISVVDKNFNLVAWNKRYIDLFHFPDSLVQVGMPIEDLIRFNIAHSNCPPGELEVRVQKRMDRLKSGEPHKLTRQRDDGRVIEVIGNPMPAGGFVTSFQDITNHVEIQQALEETNINLEQRVRKRTEEVHSINAELRLEIERRGEAEKELIRARKEAEEANASKSRFLALASHDVLQPLNAAKLYLSALQETKLDSDTTKIISKLNDSVVSSEALIGTILDISRLDQGELKPFIETINVVETLTPIINEMGMKAKEKGLDFRYKLQDGWISADRTYVYRIIQNLVSNAVKYTQTGKVLLSARKRGNRMLIEVRDTGIGIPTLQQAAIFSDFYRVENSNEQGIGLGLGVVKRLTQQLNCTVKVDSVENKGSCFSVMFDAMAPPEPVGKIVSATTSVFTDLRILCVDDQQENLDAMETLLAKWGVNTETALNAEQALEKAIAFEPQILLVDYQLGKGPDGLAIIESIRMELNIVLPACLVTAKRGEDLIKMCKEQGVNYLNKPLKPAKLRTLIQSMTKFIRSAKTQ
ncbi:MULTISPECIES: PAS-domain containing protein [Alteromonadaceae]|jgi:PAS domain S-box-containing protein|uniref:histidine kinase n=1 Tax=Brumicola blandensis TaxID=3075611 RepID=A0AAW8R544_9ALTE|nr:MULTISPECIES: PAS-domain containing protein [unclassified Alteromonas]MDT0583178.1 PAS-domain containing protein [Alteromonas sp. W409]MDT0627484.1 PAS-domain containing protein [Alteromonas sp. W364]